MATQHPGSAGDAGDGDELRDWSLGELLKQLSEQTTRLVHQELAKAELTQKGRQAGQGAGMFADAGALGLAALGALTVLHPGPDRRHAGLAGRPDRGRGLRRDHHVPGAAGPRQGQAGHPAGPRANGGDGKEDVEWAKTQTRSAKT
jgi:hypothetical protein